MSARIVSILITLGITLSGAPPIVMAAAPAVKVYTEVISLRFYDWRNALVPSSSDDPIYPYPRLDFDRVGGPVNAATTVVVLESPDVRLSIAPEYGGRILRWFDKRANRDVLYVNPIIKPTHWGYRGWWLPIGGMEWAFPTNEHGLDEWWPWMYHAFSGQNYAGVTVSDHEDRTGLDVSVTIVLHASGWVAISPRVSNQTSAPQPFQFWVNAMLPYNEALRYALPAREVEVHSTGDETLPAPGQKMSWPIYNGRDFSHAAEWQRYLGVFTAPTLYGYAAVLNPSAHTRLMRIFPANLARGVKLFSLGDLPSEIYTDGDSRYVELWGGYTRTFHDDATLQPGRSITWTEYWSVR